MNSLDITIIVVIGLCTLLGTYWGVIRQVLALGGLVAGIAIAGRNYQSVADILAGIAPSAAPNMLNLIAYLLLMFLVSLAVSVVATVLRLFVGLLFLGWLDHALGAFLGFVQGALVITVLLAALVALPSGGLTEQVDNSRLAGWWSGPVRWSLPLMPDQFQTLNESMFSSLGHSQPMASTRRPVK